MQHNKLIRDKIPEILTKKGLLPKTHIANNTEYWFKLKDKLQEEVNDFLKDSNETEIIDILEVIDAICKFKMFSKKHLELIKTRKAEQKGSFNNKIILDEV